MLKNACIAPLLLLAACSTASADLIRVTPRSPQPQLTLDKRSCTSGDVCTSDDGEAVCGYAGETCCQLRSGTNPYTCPPSYPYCCPVDASTGDLMCGTTSSCSGPVQDDSGSTPKKSLGNIRFDRNTEGWNSIFGVLVAVAAAVV